MTFLTYLNEIELTTSSNENDLTIHCPIVDCREELYSNYGILLAGTIISEALLHFSEKHRERLK